MPHRDKIRPQGLGSLTGRTTCYSAGNYQIGLLDNYQKRPRRTRLRQHNRLFNYTYIFDYQTHKSINNVNDEKIDTEIRIQELEKNLEHLKKRLQDLNTSHTKNN